jgi:histidinol phosphatase-like PHP family hydrolase
LQKRPKWSEDLRGDLQMHSTWSDGSGAVPEIAAAAEERGTNMPRSPIIRLRIAKAAGVHTSLGTDADGPAKLRFMESSALLAGIEPARIFIG